MPNQNTTLITLGVLFGIFLSALEISVVGTASPNIVRDLGGFESYAWLFTSYLFTSTITMPFWGRASDHWGRKKLFVWAMLIFTLGSIFCGLATSFWQLVGFRALQGLGAGGLLPLAFTILADVYDIAGRTRIQGFVSGVWGVSSMIGPFVGGALADSLGWRWIFWINIVPGAIAILLITKFFHETQFEPKTFKLSLKSLITSTISILSLMIWLETSKEHIQWDSLWLVLTVFITALFIYYEITESYPLVPKILYHYRIFVLACLVGFFGSALVIGLANFAPFLFQVGFGYSATEAGLFLMPLTIAWVVGSVFSTRLLLKFSYKKLLFMGFLCSTLGMLALLYDFKELTTAMIIIDMILIGAGLAFNYPIVMLCTQYQVPKDHVGFATSAIFWIRHIGGTVGTAFMGMTLHMIFQKGLATLPAGRQSDQLVQEIAKNPNQLLHHPFETVMQSLADIHTILMDGLFWVFAIMTACIGFCVVLWLGFPPSKKMKIINTK